MSVTLTKVVVQDRAFEKILDRAIKKDHDGACLEAAKTLNAFGHVPVADRILYIPTTQRRELEKIFQGPITTAEELVPLVQRLANIKFGEVTYVLTPGQAAALAEQARFHGKTTEDWVKFTLDGIMEELFGRL